MSAMYAVDRTLKFIQEELQKLENEDREDYLNEISNSIELMLEEEKK